jgi:hypothetical protein
MGQILQTHGPPVIQPIYVDNFTASHASEQLQAEHFPTNSPLKDSSHYADALISCRASHAGFK